MSLFYTERQNNIYSRISWETILIASIVPASGTQFPSSEFLLSLDAFSPHPYFRFFLLPLRVAIEKLN